MLVDEVKREIDRKFQEATRTGGYSEEDVVAAREHVHSMPSLLSSASICMSTSQAERSMEPPNRPGTATS